MAFSPHLGIEYALLWWLMLEAIGVIALPLTFRLCRHLPDRGYALAKPLGLILVNRKKDQISTATWGLIGGLSIVNVVIAVLW